MKPINLIESGAGEMPDYSLPPSPGEYVARDSVDSRPRSVQGEESSDRTVRSLAAATPPANDAASDEPSLLRVRAGPHHARRNRTAAMFESWQEAEAEMILACIDESGRIDIDAFEAGAATLPWFPGLELNLSFPDFSVLFDETKGPLDYYLWSRYRLVGGTAERGAVQGPPSRQSRVGALTARLNRMILRAGQRQELNLR